MLFRSCALILYPATLPNSLIPHWPHASHECPTFSPQEGLWVGREGQAQAQAARPSPSGHLCVALLPVLRGPAPGSRAGDWLCLAASREAGSVASPVPDLTGKEVALVVPAGHTASLPTRLGRGHAPQTWALGALCGGCCWDLRKHCRGRPVHLISPKCHSLTIKWQ